MDLLNKALEITAIGMGGIFLFMLIFFIAIRLLNKFFPGERPHHSA
jgi:Na+-transporting methylmalonyl-CoA/oxaloacetate decarboxylase gamma subunit